MLYDQRDHYGPDSFFSDNEQGANPLDSSVADDFVVPGPFGSAVTERVRFYLDAGGLPGGVIATIRNAQGTLVGGSLSIPLGPSAPTLSSGHYWVAVQGNTRGGWLWNTRTVTDNGPAAWENPRNGYGTGCITWGTLNACLNTDVGDFMFALEGLRS